MPYSHGSFEVSNLSNNIALILKFTWCYTDKKCYIMHTIDVAK